MPQAYYMLCRKFPDSYNKETARHHISSAEQIKITVTWSYGAECQSSPF